jgi:hypothetical protein
MLGPDVCPFTIMVILISSLFALWVASILSATATSRTVAVAVTASIMYGNAMYWLLKTATADPGILPRKSAPEQQLIRENVQQSLRRASFEPRFCGKDLLIL